MDDPNLAQSVVISALSAAATALTTFVTTTRRHGQRIDSLLRRVGALEGEKETTRLAKQSMSDRIDEVERAATAAASTASRASRARQQSLPDIQALVSTAVETYARIHLQPKLDRALEEVAKARNIAEQMLPRAQFASHVESEAERWNEVHRALGLIEGTLQAIRDQLRR